MPGPASDWPPLLMASACRGLVAAQTELIASFWRQTRFQSRHGPAPATLGESAKPGGGFVGGRALSTRPGHTLAVSPYGSAAPSWPIVVNRADSAPAGGAHGLGWLDPLTRHRRFRSGGGLEWLAVAARCV